MSIASWSTAKFVGSLVADLVICVCAIVVAGNPRPAGAQEARKAVRAMPTSETSLVARGKYIVEDVAMCGTCHTPRKPNGELDRGRGLAGAPVPYLPAQPTPDWPTVAPRLFGQPPASDVAMVTLLTTTIWTDGKQLRDPMPKFHMSTADAEAVVAYLKSLGR